MVAAVAPRRGLVPTWWSDAKLGVFIHWVPASVPGFAPTERSITELLTQRPPIADPLSETPYSEWYENSLRFPASSVSRFHRERYGSRPYAAFADDFVAGLDRWDPAGWARRFAAAGAGYVVLVTKHHDGWCLWPTSVSHPRRPGWFSRRDLVGELAEEVRAVGMRFGVYYSGGYDWTFDDSPIGTLADGIAAVPRGDYIAYADAQVRELIDRYRPSVVWNDIAWPSSHRSLVALMAYYFARVPDGVVNDRWATSPDLSRLLALPGVARLVDAVARRSIRRRGLVPPVPRVHGFRTPEFTTFPGIDHRPWEVTRGMDQGFGYNRSSTETHFMTREDLIGSFVDIVSKGGNLLINVGPRGEDATIPDEQVRRLHWLGEFMDAHGAAIRGTRPWVRSGCVTPEGAEVSFTARGERVWAVVPTRGECPAGLTLPLRATARTVVTSSEGTELRSVVTDAGLRVELGGGRSGAGGAVSVAVDHAEAR